MAGGTSLALQIGHRTSIDLGLFGVLSIEPDEILEIIRPLGMLNLYADKYADGSSFMIIKSLSYFDDAEEEPEPLMFKPVEWNVVKQELRKQISTL